MKTTTLFGTIAGILGLVPALHAMTLNPRGTGQVLLYPYFTVNGHQQTLLSVANTTGNGKALRIRFNEAYNGREVLDFNIFLAPYDIWTAMVFSLSDAGIAGDSAAIAVTDKSCTAPSFATLTATLPNGSPYQPFLPFEYTGANSDSGPTDTSRTREGNFEIIEMGEITGATLVAIEHANGMVADCSQVWQLAGPIPATDVSPPAGGLAGSAAIVNVAEGTMYAFNATAIDGFRDQAVLTLSGTPGPDLSDAVSDSSTGTATAYVPIAGKIAVMNYSSDQSIDAVSALLMADHISTEWDVTPSLGAQTDWVITMPTKHFYTDPMSEQVSSTGGVIPPFQNLFGQPTPGRSDSGYNWILTDREGNIYSSSGGIQPPPPDESPFGYETQVISFLSHDAAQGSLVLGSSLFIAYVTGGGVNFNAGQMILDLRQGVFGDTQALRPSLDGYTMQGLPVIGFEAINYINANVTPGVLANYSGAYPMRATVSCNSMAPPTDPSSPCTVVQ